MDTTTPDPVLVMMPVVAGIDNSPAAEVATRWAAGEAARMHAQLRLVHAIRPGTTSSDAGDVVYKAVHLARSIAPGIAIDTKIESGAPSASLIRASRTAQVVVIGSRGLGIRAGGMVGSTGLDLAANAHCPVVVVRPDPGHPTGTHVVIGYDGSPASDVALTFGIEHARFHDLAVRVVAAQPLGTELHSLTAAELTKAVHARDGHDAELVQITGHPAEQLLRHSDDAALIVLGARGRGGFAGMLIGSVSQTVLHQAECPVAIIPATES
ncbi:universal stress protein [Kribbella sp. NPDC058245]|uniref:universal stress protein n=1 Tax=Kribbella sp. NPDC058245 TaxID=3346399 RepID=UPI0036F14608